METGLVEAVDEGQVVVTVVAPEVAMAEEEETEIVAFCKVGMLMRPADGRPADGEVASAAVVIRRPSDSNLIGGLAVSGDVISGE